MKLKTFLLSKYLPALFLVLHATLASASVSIGPNNTQTTSTTHEYQADYATWLVADLADPLIPEPIEIGSSYSSGYWTQTLTFASGADALTTGDVFDIQQLLLYTGGDFNLASWNQQIISPGWEWVSATIFDSDTSAELAGLNVQLTATQFNATFNALDAGTSLIFAGQLKYAGPGAPASSVTLQVVPEPASAALGLLGTLFLLRRRRLN